MHAEANFIVQLRNELSTHNTKYTYYKLSLMAAAIAFTITQTNSLQLDYGQTPLALAVLSWVLGIVCGFQIIDHEQNLLHKKLCDINSSGGEGFLHIEREDLYRLRKLGRRQVCFMIFGALLYLLWHIYEMASRTL